MLIAHILLPLAAYLFGSIPFGLVIGRLFYHTDIRSHGSGNIGAMNAMRALGKGGAAAVLLLDALKGFIPAFIAMTVFAPFFHDRGLHDRYVALVGALAIVGHCFSPWLGFKGGKGVATGLGAMLGVCWPAALVGSVVWLITAVLSRYSSLSSMLGCVASSVAVLLFTHSWWLTAWGIFVTLLILYAHRENIARLRAGTENRITLRKASSG